MAQSPTLFPLSGPARTLPMRCHPELGESFNSYMERLADLYKAPLSLLVSKIGLVRTHSSTSIPAWGVAMTDSQLQNFCRATRIDEGDARALLLTSFNGTFANFLGIDPSIPSAVQQAALREWIIFNGSHFCPLCLSEAPRKWLLRWKLNWSFACVKHHSLLRDSCSDCGRPSGRGRGDLTTTPAYLGKVFQNGCCRNIRLTGSGGRGMGSTPCGAELWTQDTMPLPSVSRVLSAQARVDQYVDCAIPIDQSFIPLFEHSERRVTAKAEEKQFSQPAIRLFAQETRSLAALLLYCAKPTDFCIESPEMQHAVNAHLDERVQILQGQAACGRSAPRRRVYSRSTISTALAAAVLTPAVEILMAKDHKTLVETLIPLAIAAREHGNIHNRQLARDFHFTTRLSDAFREATAATGSFGRTSSHYPSIKVAHRTKTFGPQHVPQLMPEALYQKDFSWMLPHVLSQTGRRFCAMAAAKSFGLSWADSAAILELPSQAVSYTKKAIPLLNALNHQRAFLDAISVWLEHLRLSDDPVDYQARRTRLREFSDVPAPLWELTCEKAGIQTGQPGRRSRYASAWLWADLTQGDWRLAPAMYALRDTPNAREIYTRMIRFEIPHALDVLRKAGQSLLYVPDSDFTTAETARPIPSNSLIYSLPGLVAHLDSDSP